MAMLERKFDELKIKLIDEIQKELFLKLKVVIDDEILKATNDLKVKQIELESEVAILQKHVTYLKDQNCDLLNETERNEQYSRRQCLRLYGVEISENEREDVFEVVQSIIKEENCNIPSEMIDRAHRIGQVKVDKDTNIKQQDIIIKFVTFRHRTEFYRARKEFKSDIRVGLDLTRKRYQLLKDGRALIDGNPKVKFLYADINCNLKIHPADGQDRSFSSLNELKEILGKL